MTRTNCASAHSPPPTTFDAVVVGGGIVGLATALALRGQGLSRVAVMEAEAQVGRHQSGRNSGIVHAGLYYRPGSAKARLCQAGRETLAAFCDAHGIPFQRTGKLVVAVDEEELPALRALAERGRANGLRDPVLLYDRELQKVEPLVGGVAGLLVRETGLVDFGAVCRRLAEMIGPSHGGSQVGSKPGWCTGVNVGSRVLDARTARGCVRVRTSRGALEAGLLVNCAGLEADRLARGMGVRSDLRIVPFRGDYFRLRNGERLGLARPVYPVPDPDLPFLGVHVHPTLDGGLEAGPNAVLALSRRDYSPGAVRLRDAWDTVTFSGFWRLSSQHWRVAASELSRSLSRTRFARDVARLLPGVKPADLGARRSGLRAQALDGRGRLVDDFHVEEGERSLHVLNSPSPAATASLAIGEEIAARLVGCRPDPDPAFQAADP